ncbi:MAG: hypothetical protein EBZ59_04405 [Planctomycetia bacterium]|nr:hypothetical protein [Planctomycetia bacterium]
MVSVVGEVVDAGGDSSGDVSTGDDWGQAGVGPTAGGAASASHGSPPTSVVPGLVGPGFRPCGGGG